MIQPGSKLHIQDNSGARIVECIRVLKKAGRNAGYFGDFAVVSVKSLRKKGRIKVKKKELCIALILKTSKENFRRDGMSLKFSNNTCILLSKDFKSHGTRIFGSVREELRSSNFVKLLSISSNYI